MTGSLPLIFKKDVEKYQKIFGQPKMLLYFCGVKTHPALPLRELRNKNERKHETFNHKSKLTNEH